MTREMIEEIAVIGNAIIVGRGGNHILAQRPVTLHVFILAPLDERVHTEKKTACYDSSTFRLRDSF